MQLIIATHDSLLVFYGLEEDGDGGRSERMAIQNPGHAQYMNDGIKNFMLNDGRKAGPE